MASGSAFSDLLQRAEKLSSAIVDGRGSGDVSTAFPKIQRNLDEIFEQGEKLWKKTAGVDSAAPSAPPSLFAEYEALPVEKEPAFASIEKPLETLGKRQLEPISGIRSETAGLVETSLESFLRQERENTLIAMVEETIERTTEAIERRQKQAVMANWEQRKKKLLTEASLSSLGDFAKKDAIYLPEERGLLSRTRMTDVEMAFARQVADLTAKVLQGGTRPKLVDSFLSTARALKEVGCSPLWEQVQCMLHTPVQAGLPLLEQRSSQRFKVALVDNALRYLEKQFIKHMEGIVYGHIEQARLGGAPGVYRLVHGYLNVKMPVPYQGYEDALIENHPAWAVIYYCLRSGDLGAALAACEAGGPQFTEFTAAFREMQSQDFEQLSSDVRTRLNMTYRRHVRASQDPYKRAVFVVVAMCDVTVEDQEIVDTLQNWLWYRLRQVRLHEASIFQPSSTSTATSNRPTSSLDNASLNFLQKQILEDYGERHFSSGDTPYLFWDALWLTGQFEAAIDYICRQSDLLRCHGVHVALAAYQLGVLLTPDDVQAKLCGPQQSDPPTMRRLNLVRLLLLYVSKFQDSDTVDAVNYLYFLRSFKSTKGEDMFYVALSDLVMQTGEYEIMLGSIGPDGTPKPGIADKFSFDSERLVEHVARQCEERGLNERAVALFDLAGNHTKGLEILNEMLARVCCEAPGINGDRDRTAQIALEIAKRYRELGCKAEVDISTTFYLLMDLVTFFDLYHAKRYTEAIDVIQKLNLVPLELEDVNQHVKTFYRLSEPVRRILPQILLALMSMLLTEYRRVKGHMTFGVAANTNLEAADALKKSARSLVSYIGMIPYCMPGDVTARLVQMEVLMH